VDKHDDSAAGGTLRGHDVDRGIFFRVRIVSRREKLLIVKRMRDLPALVYKGLSLIAVCFPPGGIEDTFPGIVLRFAETGCRGIGDTPVKYRTVFFISQHQSACGFYGFRHGISLPFLFFIIA
jgi:hypothetical protein